MTRRRFAAGLAALPVAFAAGCFAPAAQPGAGVQPFPSPGSIPGPGVPVPANDPAIDAGQVDFENNRDRVIAYRARPKGRGPFPGIIVLHDNRGLGDHAREVSRRLAKLGYVALAVDMLSRSGGVDNVGDASAVSNALGRLNTDRAVTDVLTSYRYLGGLDFVKADSLGLLGFDFGGTLGYAVAVEAKQVKATVLYYPTNPSFEKLGQIQSPIFAVYPENDTRLTAGIQPLADAMKKANRTFEYKVYPGTSRGFASEGNNAFSVEPAQDAWSRTIGYFDGKLKR